MGRKKAGEPFTFAVREPQSIIPAQGYLPNYIAKGGSTLNILKEYEPIYFYNKLGVPESLQIITGNSKMFEKFWDISGLGREWKKVYPFEVSFGVPAGRPAYSESRAKYGFGSKELPKVGQRPRVTAIYETKEGIAFVKEKGKEQLQLIGGGVEPILTKTGKIGKSKLRWKLAEDIPSLQKESLEEVGARFSNVKKLPLGKIKGEPYLSHQQFMQQDVFTQRIYKVSEPTAILSPSSEIESIQYIKPEKALIAKNIGATEKEIIRRYQNFKETGKAFKEKALPKSEPVSIPLGGERVGKYKVGYAGDYGKNIRYITPLDIGKEASKIGVSQRTYFGSSSSKANEKTYSYKKGNYELPIVEPKYIEKVSSKVYEYVLPKREKVSNYPSETYKITKPYSVGYFPKEKPMVRIPEYTQKYGDNYGGGYGGYYGKYPTPPYTPKYYEGNGFPPYTPPISRIKRKKNELEKGLGFGFRVLLKTSKSRKEKGSRKFFLPSGQPVFTYGGALRYGSEIAALTPRASFKVVPSQFQATVGGQPSGALLREQFRPSRAKHSVGVFVEKTKYRINAPAELVGIQKKGAQARKAMRGLFGSKKNRRLF